MRWKAGSRPVEAQLLAFGLQPAALLDATEKCVYHTENGRNIRISKLLAVMPAATVEGKVTLAAVHILEPFPPAQKDQQLHVPMRVCKMNRVISKKHIWKILNARLVRLALWNLRGTLCHKRHRWLAGQVSELAVPVHLSAGDRSMSSTFRDFFGLGRTNTKRWRGWRRNSWIELLSWKASCFFGVVWSRSLSSLAILELHNAYARRPTLQTLHPGPHSPRSCHPSVIQVSHINSLRSYSVMMTSPSNRDVPTNRKGIIVAFPQGFPTAAARCVGSRSKIHARRECHFLSAGKNTQKKNTGGSRSIYDSMIIIQRLKEIEDDWNITGSITAIFQKQMITPEVMKLRISVTLWGVGTEAHTCRSPWCQAWPTCRAYWSIPSGCYKHRSCRWATKNNGLTLHYTGLIGIHINVSKSL